MSCSAVRSLRMIRIPYLRDACDNGEAFDYGSVALDIFGASADQVWPVGKLS